MIKNEGKSGHFKLYLTLAIRFREIWAHKWFQEDGLPLDNISFEIRNGEMPARPCGAEC
jgi:hypothetical protein